LTPSFAIRLSELLMLEIACGSTRTPRLDYDGAALPDGFGWPQKSC